MGAHASRRRSITTRTVFVLIALLSMSMFTACSSATREGGLSPTIIGATDLPASASVFVAQDQGYFEDEGLHVQVKVFDAGRLALDALMRGEVDVATCAQTPLARDVDAGKDPVIIATIAEVENANYIVARKDRGIRGAADLKGKKIAVLKGTTADYFLHIYLVTAGISPEDVDVVPVDEKSLVSRVVEGDLDGASAFAPYVHDLEDLLGANAVRLDQPSLYTTMWNFVVRRDSVKSRLAEHQAVLRAISKANEFMAEDPAAAQAMVARATKSKLQDVSRQWGDQQTMLRLDQALVLSLEDELRWMTTGKDGHVPNFLNQMDSTALMAVNPRSVTVIPTSERRR